MIRKSLLTLIGCLVVSFAFAATDTTDIARQKSSGLRISLLTCGTGEQVYELFGHTAVRVIDSNVQGPLGDLVYNYGMFNGYDEQFEMKFMRGKLLYYVATNLFPDFMSEYQEYGRSVEEQVLLIDDKSKMEIVGFLKENLLIENRYYKYDFFFDNCATRIRDIFPKTLGKDFVYAETRTEGDNLTFRDIINVYFYRRHWERVGVNILLGSKIDKVMTNSDIMFLPDYLRNGLAGATLAGRRVTTPVQLLLKGEEKKAAGPNWPMLLTCSILLLTILGNSVPQLRVLGNIMSRFVLLVTGLLGCLIMVMWFATDHQGCSNNFNLLWALPVNVLLAVTSPKGRGKYAVLGIFLILISLAVHFLGVQGLVPELLPLLAALLAVFIGYYKKSKQQTSITSIENEPDHTGDQLQ